MPKHGFGSPILEEILSFSLCVRLCVTLIFGQQYTFLIFYQIIAKMVLLFKQQQQQQPPAVLETGTNMLLD